MIVVITVEQRFDQALDGSVWTPAQFPYVFWHRYLEVFEGVCVVARVRTVSSVPPTFVRSDGPGVMFAPVPYYIGPSQSFRVLPALIHACANAVGDDSAAILRIPSPIGTWVHRALRRKARPYAVEVVGDPYDSLSSGSVRHPLRPFFRWWLTRAQRHQCAGACAAAYVTARALQRRYPCGGYAVGVSDVELPSSSPRENSAAFVTHYSSVELRAKDFTSHQRSGFPERRSPTLITVGTLEQLYKGTDILIDAVARVAASGLDLRLVVVGGGQYEQDLARRAATLGIRERVVFRGHISDRSALLSQLDAADLFVLPSRQEGLPRAMIEAMARALPCIGSTVGGIPELLEENDMVPPSDVSALASKIREILLDPPRLTRMSRSNLEKSREYSDKALRARRLQFFRVVRSRTEEWLRRHAPGLTERPQGLR